MRPSLHTYNSWKKSKLFLKNELSLDNRFFQLNQLTSWCHSFFRCRSKNFYSILNWSITIAVSTILEYFQFSFLFSWLVVSGSAECCKSKALLFRKNRCTFYAAFVLRILTIQSHWTTIGHCSKKTAIYQKCIPYDILLSKHFTIYVIHSLLSYSNIFFEFSYSTSKKHH